MTRPDRQDLRPGRPPDHPTCLHLGRDLQDQRSSGICLRLDVSPREPLIGQTEATMRSDAWSRTAGRRRSTDRGLLGVERVSERLDV